MDDSASHTSLLEITSKIMIASVIIFFMVIIIIFLLHLYARCLWSATPEDPAIVAWRRQLAQQNQPSGRAPRQKGLDRSTLRSLPVAVYDPKEFKDGLECAVCLSELQQGEKVRVLPDCSHGFHLECIDKWFHSHSTCPICRTLVVAAASNEAVSGSDSNHVEPQQDEGDVDSSGGSMELPVFPTNVLFWGDETQVRATSLEGGSAAASSSGKPHEMLVIDIPMSSERCSNPPTPSSTARLGAEDGSRSPVVSRMKSLKRLLSRGKRVNPFYSGSSSSPGGDAEQV